MPELPEVEIIVRQLTPKVIKKTITNVEILRHSQWKNANPEDAISILINNRFKTISRRAKFILFELQNKSQLIIHLRMTGKLIYVENCQPIDKYSRTIFCFDDGSSLQFNDTRALGTLEIVHPDQKLDCLKKLGIEPLSEEFTFDKLKQLLANSKLEIKDFLIDQTKIVGIGNIYANEILFRCRIHPKRRANSITSAEVETMFHIIPKVLLAAISCMGTTLGNKVSDYRNVYNMNGDFQSLLQVYGRTDEPCFTCGTAIIRITQKGRSSYYCEKCQS